MADVRITDNSAEVLAALGDQLEIALEAVGLKAEGYAKRLSPVDTGRLRNSITHAVDMDEDKVYIGTNVVERYTIFGGSFKNTWNLTAKE